MQPNPTYQPRDYRRVCDYCGSTYLRSELQTQDTAIVCDTCVDRMGPITKDKLAARAKKPLTRGVRDAAPFAGVPLYQVEESEVIEYLSDAAVTRGARYDACVNDEPTPLPNPSGIYFLNSLAWAGLYFYGVATDTNVPAAWVTSARAQLRTIMDTWLVPHQTAVTSGGLFSGAFALGELPGANVTDHAVAGLVALNAYRLFGDASYLACATNVAHFLRNAQSGDKLTGSVNYPVNDSAHGTSRWHSGALYYQIAESPTGNAVNYACYPDQLIAAWFWLDLKSVTGDITVGNSSVSGSFLADASATLSTCISELRAFWTNGAGSPTVVGFSSTAMAGYFSTWDSVGAGTNAWAWGDSAKNVHGVTVAKALWALYKLEGYSEQVADVYTYVRGFTSNSTYEPVTDEFSETYTPPGTVYVDGMGTYKPKVCLATKLNTVDGNNGSSCLAWATAGLLAEIQSTRDSANLAAAKLSLVALSENAQSYTGAAWTTQTTTRPVFPKVRLRGRSGLAYQQAFSFLDEYFLPEDDSSAYNQTPSAADVANAYKPLTYVDEVAMAGFLFRYQFTTGQVS